MSETSPLVRARPAVHETIKLCMRFQNDLDSYAVRARCVGLIGLWRWAFVPGTSEPLDGNDPSSILEPFLL